MRDAHQSLLATRIRTYDLLKAAKPTEKYQKIYSHLKCGEELLMMLHIDS